MMKYLLFALAVTAISAQFDSDLDAFLEEDDANSMELPCTPIYSLLQMENTQRKLVIGGNWKCNGTMESTQKLIAEVLNKAEFSPEKVEVVVAPISIHVGTVKALVNPNVKVAVQNMSASDKGAFTGEICGEQIVDFGLEWVIIGHSERRTLFGETDA